MNVGSDTPVILHSNGNSAYISRKVTFCNFTGVGWLEIIRDDDGNVISRTLSDDLKKYLFLN